MPEVASSHKVTYHREKISAYLRHEKILPASLELDISTQCNRRCPLCPSTTSAYASRLDLDFIERLFVRLAGQTRGLLLSGGEPTLSPIFPEVLRLARQYEFLDVAIVTNGDLLDKGRVSAALCADASAVRVSIYDWTPEPRENLDATLRRIASLRSRIDRDGSKLQIGVSALTTRENADGLGSIAREVSSAGAHWIYFHPLCIRWEVAAPERVDQSGVLAKIKECQAAQSNGFHAFTCQDRYVESKLEFSGYHAAHFLLVIGADGMNYLGAEVKYHPQYAIADLTKKWDDDFLWRTERLERIAAIDSRTYPAVASRHRSILYNQVIQGLVNRGEQSLDGFATSAASHVFPHIL